MSDVSLGISDIPRATSDLRYFSPFVDWALSPIHERLADLGVKSTDEILFAAGLPLISALSWTLRRSSEPSQRNVAVELNTIKAVVAEAEWLTWNEYLLLVVADHSGGFEGAGTILLLSEDPKELQRKVHFLSLLIEQKILEPFKPVLEKVIQRYLLEEEMRKKYGAAVAKRYLDFRESGRSLKFEWNDLEKGSKNTEP